MKKTRSVMMGAAGVVAWAGAALAQQGGAGETPPPPDQPIPGLELSWYTIDGGGMTYFVAGDFTLGGTTGQPDSGSVMTAECYELKGGFWPGVLGAAADCYANCDGSGVQPILNVADFTCFLQKFAQGDCYANCDGSLTAPQLNVADFTCFLQKFAQGCP